MERPDAETEEAREKIQAEEDALAMEWPGAKTEEEREKLRAEERDLRKRTNNFDLNSEWDIDFTKHKPPFNDSLFKDALYLEIKNPFEIPTKRTLLKWLESDSVLPHLKEWKSRVVDQRKLCLQIEKGFGLDERQSSDTIDCIVALCFETDVKGDNLPDGYDAFEATALTVATLVQTNEGVDGCPTKGMIQKGKIHWCYSVFTRLLIVVFCDMRKSKSGYFMKLLGGPALPRITKKKDAPWMMRIDNRPLANDDEMGGMYSYAKLLEEFPWLNDL